MAKIKQIAAENISRLRTTAGMTQAELARILNYSDKAVSKWERGESLPDIVVLKQIADIFNVTLDFLVTEHAVIETPNTQKSYRWMSANHYIITMLSVLCVWFVSTVIFVSGYWTGANMWMCFIVPIPISLIIILIFNSVWGKVRYNMHIISLLIWSVLAVIYLALLKYNYWLIFFIGIPLQIATIISFKFSRKK